MQWKQLIGPNFDLFFWHQINYFRTDVTNLVQIQSPVKRDRNVHCFLHLSFSLDVVPEGSLAFVKRTQKNSMVAKCWINCHNSIFRSFNLKRIRFLLWGSNQIKRVSCFWSCVEVKLRFWNFFDFFCFPDCS